MRRLRLERSGATFYVFSLLLGLALVPTLPAAADASPDAHTPQTEAPVIVFNRTIAMLRAPFLGADAVERARRTERNLGDLLARSGAGVVTIHSSSFRIRAAGAANSTAICSTSRRASRQRSCAPSQAS
jgi:hypothetical protein